jgi:hypothetical protein
MRKCLNKHYLKHIDYCIVLHWEIQAFTSHKRQCLNCNIYSFRYARNRNLNIGKMHETLYNIYKCDFSLLAPALAEQMTPNYSGNNHACSNFYIIINIYHQVCKLLFAIFIPLFVELYNSYFSKNNHKKIDFTFVEQPSFYFTLFILSSY